MKKEPHKSGKLVYDPQRHTHDSPLYIEGSKPNPSGDITREEGGVVGSSEWIWLDAADARHIVHCWNSHEALTKALSEDELPHPDDYAGDLEAYAADARRWFERNKEAIAIARGEE